MDAAFRNQIGELDFPGELPTADPAVSCTFRPGPGYKWGYGLLLNPADIPGMRRAWSGAWAGLCNTQFWIDRTADVCASVYSNFLPFVTPEALKLYNDFEKRYTHPSDRCLPRSQPGKRFRRRKAGPAGPAQVPVRVRGGWQGSR